MNKNQMEIIDCFTELIVYTLEFKENAQDTLYTIEKLKTDYSTLIAKAKVNCTSCHIEFDEAFFPVVSWIDEVILNSQNPAKKLWQKELLQKKYFHISNAGYTFFDRLEHLPQNAFDLRLLYLYCMFLDFKGRYYRAEDAKNLENIFTTQKALLRDDFPRIFPKIAFKKAYAQEEFRGKKNFNRSYKGIWIIIGISLAIGIVLFLASQSYLNSLLTRYNLF